MRERQRKRERQREREEGERENDLSSQTIPIGRAGRDLNNGTADKQNYLAF